MIPAVGKHQILVARQKLDGVLFHLEVQLAAVALRRRVEHRDALGVALVVVFCQHLGRVRSDAQDHRQRKAGDKLIPQLVPAQVCLAGQRIVQRGRADRGGNLFEALADAIKCRG